MDFISLPQRSQAEAFGEGETNAPEGRDGSVSGSAQGAFGAREDMPHMQGERRLNGLLENIRREATIVSPVRAS